MSTLASLIGMLGDTGIKPWYEGQQGVNREQIGRQQAQTGLIELARLKQSQASEEEVMAFYRQHPELLVGGGGMGVIASLPTTGQPQGTAPGAITQSPLGGGAAQQVPAYPDASRYANVSPQGGGPIPPGMVQQLMPQVTPPQGTIASLGPQPQGQMQAPQNPLLEMARRDPRAALLLQQQMQQSQDRQWKLQEQQLGMGVKVAEFVARELQGVTDQASLDQARERVRQVHPQAAAQMPQMYSKEGVASVQQRGIAIADRAKNDLDEAKARNLDMETRMFPELAKRFGMEGDAQAPADGGATPTTGAPPGRGPQESDTTRAIRAEATRQGVDPDLAVAVATQESYLNPNAVGDGGNAKGYFQLHKGAAEDAGIDPARRHEPGLNIQGGVGYLKLKLAQTKGNVDEALKLYNGGGDPNYVANVRRFLPGGNATAGGTAQASATDPRLAQLDAQIAKRTQDAKIASLMKNESLSTRLNDDANRLKDEKNRLIEESRRQQERAEETPRALERERLLTEQRQNLERQRQAGPMLPEEQRKLLLDLRKDVRAEPTHQLYQEVRNGYQNVRIGAESDSAQGDLAIINGLAKILDPGSTVMSGEARNVETAQGELERWFNSPQKFFTGDRISTENRPRFLKLAHAMATEKLKTARTELTAVYEPIAKKAGLDFNQLVPLEDLKPLGPGPNVSKFENILEKKK